MRKNLFVDFRHFQSSGHHAILKMSHTHKCMHPCTYGKIKSKIKLNYQYCNGRKSNEYYIETERENISHKTTNNHFFTCPNFIQTLFNLPIENYQCFSIRCCWVCSIHAFILRIFSQCVFCLSKRAKSNNPNGLLLNVLKSECVITYAPIYVCVQ